MTATPPAIRHCNRVTSLRSARRRAMTLRVSAVRIDDISTSRPAMDDGSKGQVELLDTGWHDQPLGVARIAAILRRQAGMVISLLLLAVLAGVAYIVLAEPLYTASASIYADVESADGTPAGSLVQLDTHVELIQSDRTTQAVIDELGLEGVFSSEPSLLRRAVAKARAWLEIGTSDDVPAAPDEHTQTIRGMKSGLYVERVGNTAIIDISYTSTSKAFSVEVANAYANAYIAEVAERSAQTAKRRVRLLQERANSIGKQASSTNESVQQLRFQSKVVVADAADLQRRTANLTENLTAARAEAAGVRGRLALTAVPVDLRTLPPAVLQTDVAVTIFRNFVAASDTLDQLRARPDAPKDVTAKLEASIAEMHQALEAELQRSSDALELSLAEITARQDSLISELGELSTYGQSPAWSELLDAERKAAIYQNMYSDYLNDLEHSYSQVPRRAEVRMISEALPPLGSSFPRYKVVLALAITLGAILGGALAVYREWNRSLQPGTLR